MRLILKANVRLSALMLMLTAGGASGLAQQTEFDGASPASQYFSNAAGWGQSSAYYDSIRLADVNGDGKPDLCGRGAAGIVCALGNGDGTFGALNVWTSDFSDAAGWGDPQYGTTIMFADINNDGLADVCGRAPGGIQCDLSTGSSFKPLTSLASEYFSDAAGWNQSSAYYDSIRLADVNGDGKPDLCGRGYAGIVCAPGNGDGTFGPLNVWTSDFSNAEGWGNPQYGTTIMFADINNDGLADVCGRAPEGIQCDLSTGSSFSSLTSLASEYFSDAAGWGQSSAYYDSIRLADVNGDGKPDLCGRGYAGIVCALGNGDGTFGALTVWTPDFSNAAGWGDPQYGTTIMFADTNKDGSADVCGRGAAVIFCALSADLQAGSAYNRIILRDHPVAFWQMNPEGNTESDLSGNGNNGTYKCGVNTAAECQVPSPTAAMPLKGDYAAVFNGVNEYLSVGSKPAFSIPTTHNLTWEAWIQPMAANLQFPYSSSDGYVDFMGKCAQYSTCEWEARFYDTQNQEIPSRPNRLSAYVFNADADVQKYGAGADWQPDPGVFYPGEWLHVVGEYTTLSQPAVCQDASTYPGSINIWVNGVKWDQSAHGQTGCMSQPGDTISIYVRPQTTNSDLNIGTMAGDTWFQGAIGKVAVYNYLLSQEQITSHYEAMTGKLPTGHCGDTCNFNF